MTGSHEHADSTPESRSAGAAAVSEAFAFRCGELADVAAITALIRRAFEVHVAGLGRVPRPMLADYRAMLETHDIRVAQDARGTIVGALVLELGADHVYIDSVAVEPHLQGRGIGRRLLALAEEVALERATPVLRLHVSALWTANLALYRSLGYREVSRAPDVNAERLLYEKRIGSEPR
ncbi:MAG: GNAT family N-acetyltransferase [Pseudomonadota bacterium]